MLSRVERYNMFNLFVIECSGHGNELLDIHVKLSVLTNFILNHCLFELTFPIYDQNNFKNIEKAYFSRKRRNKITTKSVMLLLTTLQG